MELRSHQPGLAPTVRRRAAVTGVQLLKLKGYLYFMSFWTHVDGFINFSNSVSYGHITDFLGPQSVFGNRFYKDAPLPLGSEGSVRYNVGMLPYMSVGEVNYEGITVGLLGNLRDFDSLDAIKLWLDSIPTDFVNALYVRSDDDEEPDNEVFDIFVRNAFVTATTMNETKAWRWSHDLKSWEEIPWN